MVRASPANPSIGEPLELEAPAGQLPATGVDSGLITAAAIAFLTFGTLIALLARKHGAR